MILYELNQSICNSLPEMNDDEITEQLKKIIEFSRKNDGEFFTLICRELNYYTLFHRYSKLLDWTEDLAKEVIDVIKTLGVLKAIEINDSMVEFWIQQDKECHMYAFFNYDKGVIKV